MNNEKITIIVKGTVIYAGTDMESGANTISLEVSATEAMRIDEFMKEKGLADEWSPVKPKNGIFVMKASTKYAVAVYDAEAKRAGMEFDSIGKGSAVRVYVELKETSFRGKVGTKAYLKSIQIEKKVERGVFNPFE